MPEHGSDVIPEAGPDVIPEAGSDVIPEAGPESGMGGSRWYRAYYMYLHYTVHFQLSFICRLIKS